MKATYKRRNFLFKIPGGTSRGVLHSKDSWFLTLTDDLKTGLGECSIIEGLSIDDLSGFESKLEWLCLNINKHPSYLFVELSNYPSIVFGLEMALRSLNSLKENVLFPSDFTEGKDSIPINGLVWMGDIDFMKSQVDKLEAGFSCIKLKIGALDFNLEFALLKSIRDKYDPSELEIRLDQGKHSLGVGILNKLSKFSLFNSLLKTKGGSVGIHVYFM